MSNGPIEPDMRLSPVCGVFCPSCVIYIAQRDTEENRLKVAELLRVPPEAIRCDGCRAEVRFSYCETCGFGPCAARKGIDFCNECGEYPCQALREFQAAYPHRAELWEANARIREAGYEKWFKESLRHYLCPRCGTINSAYHLACRNCGASPSCEYVLRHGDKVKEFLSRRRP